MNRWLLLQDPESDGESRIGDALATACQHADDGLFLYAFASPGGVDALMATDGFQSLATTGRARLVVGIDAVTTRDTLLLLQDYEKAYPGLTVAVAEPVGSSIFHPKTALLHYPQGHFVAITGSGNLTIGGLVANTEAAIVAAFDEVDGATAWQTLEGFLSGHRVQPVNQHHLDRAARNAGERIQRTTTVSMDGALRVLVAAVPKSGTRWRQVNFPYGICTDFFGVTPGSTDTIRLRQIRSDGTSGKPIDRRCVDSGSSHNYRLEFDIPTSLDYPADGRPMLVVLRSPEEFRYRVLLPGDGGYEKVRAFAEAVPPSHGQLARRETSLAELDQVWGGHLLDD